MSKLAVKVLIVDDRHENVLALQAVLKDSGYQIFEALSGRDALQLIKDNDFACILLDVQMPLMDGFETARAVRQIPRAERTPILFVTAIHRSDEYVEMGYVAGAVDYLFKPVNPTILKSKIGVFADLYLQAEEIKHKNILLQEAILRSKENEQLKQALAERDEFLMMASHELKTPMTPLSLQMQTFIQIFREGVGHSIEPERLLRMLETSLGQIERLTRLVNELVDASRIAGEKLMLDRRPVVLSDLVQKVLDEFQDEIKKAGCEVSLNENAKAVGNWDPFRIEQVIINLLSNSLKYGVGRPIELAIDHGSAGRFRFSIKDNGIGVSKEDHGRIFNRFERAVSSKSFSGLGLGLYISKQIISLHEGSIWVESGPGSGARFVVELPACS